MIRIVWALAMLVMCSTAVSAHSKINKMVPPDGAIVAEVPQEVSLTFGDDIRLTKVSMSHGSASSEDLDLGDQTSFSKSYVIPMQDHGAGDYVILWRGLGIDGHTMKGEFSFSVE